MTLSKTICLAKMNNFGKKAKFGQNSKSKMGVFTSHSNAYGHKGTDPQHFHLWESNPQSSDSQ